MTDVELRAAAIGILIYEHLLQTGGGELDAVGEDGDKVQVDFDADIVDEYMEAALALCAAVEIDQNVKLSM